MWKYENMWKCVGRSHIGGWGVKMSGEHKRGEIEASGLSNNGGQNIHSRFVCMAENCFAKRKKGNLVTMACIVYKDDGRVRISGIKNCCCTCTVCCKYCSIHIFWNAIGSSLVPIQKYDNIFYLEAFIFLLVCVFILGNSFYRMAFIWQKALLLLQKNSAET